MKSFFNDEDGFSIKDLYGLIFCFLFTGIVIYTLVVGSPEQKVTAINLLQIISPLVLTLLGGYAVTEGAKGIINTYSKSKQDVLSTIEVRPATEVTPTPPIGQDSDGAI